MREKRDKTELVSSVVVGEQGVRRRERAERDPDSGGKGRARSTSCLPAPFLLAKARRTQARGCGCGTVYACWVGTEVGGSVFLSPGVFLSQDPQNLPPSQCLMICQDAGLRGPFLQPGRYFLLLASQRALGEGREGNPIAPSARDGISHLSCRNSSLKLWLSLPSFSLHCP